MSSYLQDVDSARKGDEVCVKIEAVPGEAPKMFGRHFDETDLLVSKVGFFITLLDHHRRISSCRITDYQPLECITFVEKSQLNIVMKRGHCHFYNRQKYSGCIFVKNVWLDVYMTKKLNLLL